MAAGNLTIKWKEFIDSCNDTHFLISDLEIASIKYIGITEQMTKSIEIEILDEEHLDFYAVCTADGFLGYCMKAFVIVC